MRSFFKNHPIVGYNDGNLQLRNIMLSAQLTKEVLGEYTNFLPYTVKEGETPATLAHDYYGHIDYTWLVLLSNRMIEPYTSWVKTQEQLEAYIQKEYGSVKYAYSAIKCLRHVTESDVLPDISILSWQNLPAHEQQDYRPIYLYDWLVAENERKRQIRLVDKVHAPRISLELEKKLKQ